MAKPKAGATLFVLLGSLISKLEKTEAFITICLTKIALLGCSQFLREQTQSINVPQVDLFFTFADQFQTLVLETNFTR